jgi:hypothetical protein
MKGIKNIFKSPLFVSMATATKFVQPIPIFLAYLVPLVSMVTAAILKKSTLKSTTSQGICYSYKVS